MKFTLVVGAAILALIPTFGQDQTSCKAFFQVVRAHPGSPGLVAGMDTSEKKWWESEGEKKYPGLCLNGSVTSGDKPRYLLIWSKSKSMGQASLASNEIFGQTPTVLEATAPREWIYQPRWNVASVTIAYVLYDGRLDIPPVHFTAGDRRAWVFPDDRKALEAAVKFLAQEPPFSPTVH
ncbi:MAG TPA: hypothetical protein VEJ45_04215 [Candidatus Acidoferrales bacterium]|nr:hypothetical protein [Candidatus Acidoferrales bacterium]